MNALARNSPPRSSRCERGSRTGKRYGVEGPGELRASVADLDGTHLLGTVVLPGESPRDDAIVTSGECTVRVGHVEVVAVGDRPLPAVLDLRFYELTRYPPPLEVWFVVEFTNDPRFHPARTRYRSPRYVKWVTSRG